MNIHIPEPPRWLIVAIAALGVVVVAQAVRGEEIRFDPNNIPGGYAGRPPTSQKWPGKCWCRYHGPRGGCMHWHCPGKR